MAQIHIITGPPCSGKSTHVDEFSNDGDVVVDYDLIAADLGWGDSHGASGDHAMLAKAMRQRAVDIILDGINTPAWIIHSDPGETALAEYEAAAATFTELNPGIDVCLERAAADGRPQATIDWIHDWYDKRGAEGDGQLGAD